MRTIVPGNSIVISLWKIKLFSYFFLLITAAIGAVFFILYLENQSTIEPGSGDWYFYHLGAPLVVVILFGVGLFLALKETGYMEVNDEGLYHILSDKKFGIRWDDIQSVSRDQLSNFVFRAKDKGREQTFLIPPKSTWSGQNISGFISFIEEQCKSRNVEIKRFIASNTGVQVPIHHNCEIGRTEK